MALSQDIDGYGEYMQETLMYEKKNRKKRSDPSSLLRVDIQSRHPLLFRHLSRSLEFLVIRPVFLRTQQRTLNTQKSSFTLRARRRLEILDCELDFSFNLVAILINVMTTAFITLVAQTPHPIGAALGAGIGIVIGHPFPSRGNALAVYACVEEIPADQTEIGFVLEADVAFDDGARGGA